MVLIEVTRRPKPEPEPLPTRWRAVAARVKELETGR